MTDHHTSYTINAMIGRLYAKNAVFQSLRFADQQSIVLDLLAESYRSDVNIGEMLSNECFSEYKDLDETRTLSAIFNICSYCKKSQDDVKDHGEVYSRQGLCAECAQEIYPEEDMEQERVK